MTLPNFTWTRKTNSTHGQITAVVDISTGPKPMGALGYKARTLNDKRQVIFIFEIHISLFFYFYF